MFGTVLGIVLCSLFSLFSLLNASFFGYSYISDIMFVAEANGQIGIAFLFVVMLASLIAQAFVFFLNLITSLVMIKKLDGKPATYAKISIIITSAATLVLTALTVFTYIQIA